MKPQYQHHLMTSFMLWFDHTLLQKGQAYSNKTGQLFFMEDSRLPDNYKRFSSAYKQWVTDSSIVGDVNPVIPTGFRNSLAGVDYDRAELAFDFENGGVIRTGASGPGDAAVITGEFAVKDFNIYLTDQTEEDIILDSKFSTNSRYNQTESGIQPYDQVVPAIFINSEFMRNEGMAFGGEDKTTNTIKAIVLAENSYQLDGVLSIFADTRHVNIQKIAFSGHPGTEYGDLKGGSYNYLNLSSTYESNNPYYIDDVSVSKLSDRAQQAVPGDLNVGFIDFEVSTSRFPREGAPSPVPKAVTVNSTNVFNLFTQERTNLDAIGASNIFLTGEIPVGSSFFGPGSDSEGSFDARYNLSTPGTSSLIRIGVTGITFATNERFKLTPLGSTVRRTDQAQRGTFSVTTGTNLFVSGNGSDFDVSSHVFTADVSDTTTLDNYVDTTITGVEIQSQIRVTGSGDSEFIFDNGSKIVDITDFTHTLKIDNFDDD